MVSLLILAIGLIVWLGSNHDVVGIIVTVIGGLGVLANTLMMVMGLLMVTSFSKAMNRNMDDAFNTFDGPGESYRSNYGRSRRKP